MVDVRSPLPVEVVARGSMEGDATLVDYVSRMYVASRILRLGQETRFTSIVLFHRCYFYNRSSAGSGGEHDLAWSAVACLSLGCKLEEEPRRLRDFINVHYLIFESAKYNDEVSLIYDLRSRGAPELANEDYWKKKETLVATEQAMLRILQFDVSVSHVHRAVALLVTTSFATDEEHNNDFSNTSLLEEAWKMLNHALFYPPALTHDVWTMACAAVILVESRYDNEKWWGRATTTDGQSLEAAKNDLISAMRALLALEKKQPALTTR